MRLLLDTHAFLWWVSGDESLSATARRRIADPRNEVSVSVVSAWEIVVKSGAGRLTLDEPPERFVPKQLEANGFAAAPLYLRHVLGVSNLPDIHRDPFDRLIVAQAIAEDLAIVTADSQIGRYGVKVIW